MKKIKVVIQIGGTRMFAEIPLSYRFIKDLVCSKTVKWDYYDFRKDVIKIYSPTCNIDGSPVVYIGINVLKTRLKSLEWERVRELLK